MRRECWRGGSCLFLGLYPPSEHYPCLLLSVLHEYAKYDTFLLQDLQLFTTGFVDKNSTASVSPPNPGLGDDCCSKRIKAPAGREKLSRLHGSYRQDLGNGLIPINTFLMSLCCSPLLELTADGRTWLHLPCMERSLDVRCREMGQA